MNRPLLVTVLFLTACGGGKPKTAPTPATNIQATPAQLDSLWQEAAARMADHKWEKAAVLYQRLQLELPRGDWRQAASRVQIGEARMGEKSYLQAVREFRRTADEYPTDSLAPHALLRAGDAYAALWRRPELDPTYGGQALATYQELLTRYPESAVIDTAKQRIAGLNEWYAIKSYKAAEFYLKFKAYDSAILYLKDLVATYPNTKVVPQALARLIDAYRKLGYSEDVTETCDYFRRTRPEAPLLAESCPATAAGTTGAPAGTPPAP